MPPVDFLARERHFADHLIPIWEALPDELRGTFYGSEEVRIRYPQARGPISRRPRLTVVAAFRDLKLARERGRKCVLIEHGAGQSYRGTRSASYIGAPDRGGVVAVFVPGPTQARRHERAHPTIPAYAIGVPKLDRHHAAPRPRRRRKPVVAISFHWLCRVAPEARGAHVHYHSIFPELAREFDLIGHGHPRVIKELGPLYKRAGIEVVSDFEDVIDRADVYVCDNSSTMYEWASLDRPVVVLNAPWFRETVEHGLRFWEHGDLGPHVWEPAALPDAIRQAIADPEEIATRRREIVGEVYASCDGLAAKRAAALLTRLQARWAARPEARPLAGGSAVGRLGTRPIATKPIYERTAVGTRVLAVAKGSPIPDRLRGKEGK